MTMRIAAAWAIVCLTASEAPTAALNDARSNLAAVTFIVTDSSRFYYARCIPAVGPQGKPSTKIYRVRLDEDELIDEYPWYQRCYHPNRLTLLQIGFDHERRKERIVVYRPHQTQCEPAGPDKQVEFSIYVSGKLIRSFTTEDLKKLGAEVKHREESRHQPNGDYAVYKFNGYTGERGADGKSSPYGCFSFTLGEKIILIDIATGAVIEHPSD